MVSYVCSLALCSTNYIFLYRFHFKYVYNVKIDAITIMDTHIPLMQPFTPAAKKLFAHSGHRTNTTYGLCLPSCMHCATTTTTFFAYCWPIFMKTPSLGTICAFGRIMHLVWFFGDVAGAVICSVVCKSFLAMIIIFIEIVLCLYSLSVFPDNFDYYLYSILSLCRRKIVA